MTEEITIRGILEEKLNQEKRLLRAYSEDSSCLVPLRGFEEYHSRYQVKCRMIRDLIKALESEPVRTGLATWQRDVMDGQPTGLFAPGGMDQ